MIIIEQAPGKLNVQLHFIIWQIIAHLYFYTLRSARASSFTVIMSSFQFLYHSQHGPRD